MRMSPRYHIPALDTSNESRIIAHKLHSFLLHNTSLVLVSPKVHALFVPWKNRPETNTPLPTSLLMTELDTLIKNGQEKDECVTLTHTSDRTVGSGLFGCNQPSSNNFLTEQKVEYNEHPLPRDTDAYLPRPYSGSSSSRAFSLWFFFKRAPKRMTQREEDGTQRVVRPRHLSNNVQVRGIDSHFARQI